MLLWQQGTLSKLKRIMTTPEQPPSSCWRFSDLSGAFRGLDARIPREMDTKGREALALLAQTNLRLAALFSPPRPTGNRCSSVGRGCSSDDSANRKVKRLTRASLNLDSLKPHTVGPVFSSKSRHHLPPSASIKSVHFLSSWSSRTPSALRSVVPSQTLRER